MAHASKKRQFGVEAPFIILLPPLIEHKPLSPILGDLVWHPTLSSVSLVKLVLYREKKSLNSYNRIS